MLGALHPPAPPLAPWGAKPLPSTWLCGARNVTAYREFHDVAMRTTNLTTNCPMLSRGNSSFFLCTPPGAVSIEFMNSGVERLITRHIVATVLRAGGWNGQPWLIDVGMNDGLITMAGAANGARVIAYDIAPSCFPYVQASISLSGLQDNVVLRNMGVSNSTDWLLVQKGECSPGGFLGKMHGKERESRATQPVPIRTLDDEVMPILRAGDDNISMLKIDAEGAEVLIFEGARAAIATQRVRSMIVEVAPVFWPRLHTTLEQGKRTLHNVVAAGMYTVFVFPNNRERLKVGLHTNEQMIESIGYMRQIVDLDAFIDDRAATRMGCNMLFVQRWHVPEQRWQHTMAPSPSALEMY